MPADSAWSRSYVDAGGARAFTEAFAVPSAYPHAETLRRTLPRSAWSLGLARGLRSGSDFVLSAPLAASAYGEPRLKESCSRLRSARSRSGLQNPQLAACSRRICALTSREFWALPRRSWNLGHNTVATLFRSYRRCGRPARGPAIQRDPVLHRCSRSALH